MNFRVELSRRAFEFLEKVGPIRVLYKILWDEKVTIVFKIERRKKAYR